jgi:hypothetical protein
VFGCGRVSGHGGHLRWLGLNGNPDRILDTIRTPSHFIIRSDSELRQVALNIRLSRP